ncbi:unnamed protein product [Danaus chrysippus]|uniref:(African queen) hypothetical protein n=1 Tax=Danaus chrysippus TaxID=151541 RepID=A0A8J2QL02_9NEOP|nr:unnamed protein product [Danaus chrysippus]
MVKFTVVACGGWPSLSCQAGEVSTNGRATRAHHTVSIIYTYCASPPTIAFPLAVQPFSDRLGPHLIRIERDTGRYDKCLRKLKKFVFQIWNAGARDRCGGAVCGRRASCTYADPAGWLYAACHASGRRDTAFTCSIDRGESVFHAGDDNDRAVSTSGRPATVTAVLNVSVQHEYKPRSL